MMNDNNLLTKFMDIHVCYCVILVKSYFNKSLKIKCKNK